MATHKHLGMILDSKLSYENQLQSVFSHTHKKRKDSLETRAPFLIFSLELEIPGVAVQGKHQNNEKWLLSVRNFLVEMISRLC